MSRSSEAAARCQGAFVLVPAGCAVWTAGLQKNCAHAWKRLAAALPYSMPSSQASTDSLTQLSVTRLLAELRRQQDPSASALICAACCSGSCSAQGLLPEHNPPATQQSFGAGAAEVRLRECCVQQAQLTAVATRRSNMPAGLPHSALSTTTAHLRAWLAGRSLLDIGASCTSMCLLWLRRHCTRAEAWPWRSQRAADCACVCSKVCVHCR